MFYDLNTIARPEVEPDIFTISGHKYEIGPIGYQVKFMIAEIDDKKDILSQMRPIVEKVMRDWNDNVHDLLDNEVVALFKIITQKMNG